MFIEVIEFEGKHINLVINELSPKVLPVFQKLIKVRKNLRQFHPAVLMRSFLGMFFAYYVTDILIAGTVIAKLMPKNSFEQFVDIYLHGVIKESA
jgi:hypothetical protein